MLIARGILQAGLSQAWFIPKPKRDNSSRVLCYDSVLFRSLRRFFLSSDTVMSQNGVNGKLLYLYFASHLMHSPTFIYSTITMARSTFGIDFNGPSLRPSKEPKHIIASPSRSKYLHQPGGAPKVHRRSGLGIFVATATTETEKTETRNGFHPIPEIPSPYSRRWLSKFLWQPTS